ncbi:hypothetical protein FHU38_002853 [Saccharomonospora amisosensis]|uniref:Uncharacterized protein n=1 Tax=Saccharomonospora amisosensis TaxID=1128677 RepID=A0A7X5URP5_9PSEU|nr:hypothetical protein [Saccharomonospora amisosensis]NIJ12509.1 hypothetical protein [Saccharomonospora amisosensis]
MPVNPAAPTAIDVMLNDGSANPFGPDKQSLPDATGEGSQA